MKNLRNIILAISVVTALGFISKRMIHTVENYYKNSIQLLSSKSITVAPPVSL